MKKKFFVLAMAIAMLAPAAMAATRAPLLEDFTNSG